MTAQLCLRCAESTFQRRFEGTDRLYSTTDERFQIVRCTSCGMLRLFPQPEAAALSRYYPSDYWFDPAGDQLSRLAETYRRLVLRDHIGFVLRAYRSGGGSGPLLDVGCGGGLLAGMLRDRGVSAFGLDFSPAACSIAWHQHAVPAVTGQLGNAPFAAHSVCTVTLFHVLEHLPDPARYLRSAHELLCPSGRLVVQVPNADSWQSRILGAHWNGLDIPRHLNDFRLSDLRVLLESTGFEIVRTKHFSWRDNPAGFASSLAPSLDPMARRIRRLPSTVFHLGAYFALVVASVPFAVLEAAFGHGSSVMIEARRVDARKQ